MSSKTDDDRDLLIFELIQKRFESEWERLRSLDNKANGMIGFVSLAVSFLLGTGTLGFFDIDNLNKNVAGIFVTGIGVLIFAIMLALYGFKIRRWDVVPDVNYLIKEYKDKPYSTVLKRTGATFASAIGDMEKQINDKAKFIHYSWYAIIVGLSLVLIFVIAAIIFGISVKSVE